jgi:hypothetical protein
MVISEKTTCNPGLGSDEFHSPQISLQYSNHKTAEKKNTCNNLFVVCFNFPNDWCHYLAELEIIFMGSISSLECCDKDKKTMIC